MASDPVNPRPLFVYDPHRDGNQLCTVYGKRFRRKSAMHGLMHARAGEVKATLATFRSTWEFSVLVRHP